MKMKKKTRIWILGILPALIILPLMASGIFHFWEYATGSKYINYLTENSETIPLEKSFSYSIMAEDLEKSKLILVGESHGFDEPSKFDVDFFKYLHENHNVNHYVAEFDYVQAILLNEFLVSGNEDLLSDVLKKWVVGQGRMNLDYFNKYIELHKYYNQLPEDNKFEFIGIDKVQDLSLIARYLNSLIPGDELEKLNPDEKSKLLSRVDTLSYSYRNNPDTLFILSHIDSNLQHIVNKESREEVMFQNFYSLYKNKGLEKSKVYGFFGLYHVFQHRVNGNHPLASKIRQSDLGLENEMLSVNFMMNDSYMVTLSSRLPGFMQDEGKYTRMPVTADNMLVMYIYGVKDFKRMTPENNKSMMKMNGSDNPYAGSNRLNKTIQLLPVTDIFKMTDKGLPYVQYTIFVRNSDWAEPMIEN